MFPWWGQTSLSPQAYLFLISEPLFMHAKGHKEAMKAEQTITRTRVFGSFTERKKKVADFSSQHPKTEPFLRRLTVYPKNTVALKSDVFPGTPLIEHISRFSSLGPYLANTQGRRAHRRIAVVLEVRSSTIASKKERKLNLEIMLRKNPSLKY